LSLSLHRACVVIPALNAERTITAVASGAREHVPTVLVVDDGSTDATATVARDSGAALTAHAKNRGKGAALRTGLEWAREHGYEVVITLDADGQHPPSEIPKLFAATSDPEALVLGVRDLAGANAPRANQMSNGFSNWFLSTVTRTRLRDTQCGLRRYPVRRTLMLGVRDEGFGFETEVLLRALRAGMPIIQTDIAVLYPTERTTHFDSRRDPWRIVGRVLRTLLVDR
jgi:glycosyltransferase involved in cell wall biosynthesis